MTDGKILYEEYQDKYFKLKNFCLENKLYESTHSNSGFLRFYKGERSMSLLSIDNFIYTLAFDKYMPIGISIFELIKDPYKVGLKAWHVGNNGKIPDISANKHFSIYGNVGVYVNDNYRHQGIGSKLIKNTCQRAYIDVGQHLDDVPSISASGKSEIIASSVKNNPYHYVFNCPVKSLSTDKIYNSQHTKHFTDIFYYGEKTDKMFSELVSKDLKIQHPKKEKAKTKKQKIR